MPGLHHVEVWVADLAAARAEWGWLLTELGFERTGEWAQGETWRTHDGPYLTLTTSPNLSGPDHDRRAPGVNHLAFIGGSRAQVNAVMASASAHGWRSLYQASQSGSLRSPGVYRAACCLAGDPTTIPVVDS